MVKPLVLLDPGHGGSDPGAVYNGLQEKDLNLKLALMVARKLNRVKVMLTRKEDNFVSLAERVAISKRLKPKLFLSLHANAGGGRGFESFIHSSHTASHPAAVMQAGIHREIMAVLNRWQIIDRGCKRAGFYVLRMNPYPAVLIESLFIDHEAEARLWREESFVEALSSGVVNGIYRALNLEKSAVEEVKPFTGQTLYTVQVGAFSYLDNAETALAQAQQAGFSDAFIYRKEL